MNTTRERQWSAIMALSRRMLEAAKAQAWDDLLTLEPRRRELLDTFFAQAVDAGEAQTVAAGIQEILQRDEEITRLGEAVREQAAVQLKAMSKGRRAVQAYARHQEPGGGT